MTTRREHHWLNRLRHVESPSTAADTRGIALRHHPNRAKRPTQPQCQSASLAGSKRKLEFECDWQGRRIKKVTHAAWNGSSYATVATTKFIYDGWNLPAELDSSNNLIRSYVWGTDLIGTMQEAGGVGGLLFVKESDGTPHLAAHDGNGNVMGLVKGADGTRTATYEYDPFGHPLRATGSMALANPMRFSAKFTDNDTGLLYYGYRYYSPSLGGWVNRNPIGERGGFNLYAILHNQPIGRVDSLGLTDWVGPPSPRPPLDPKVDPKTYNCAGAAFGDYSCKSKIDTLAKLASCSASRKDARCLCGQFKCHYYDISRFDTYNVQGIKNCSQPANDFHIDCGDEDGRQCAHKNGPNPIVPGVDFDTHQVGPSNPLPPGISVKTIYTDKYYC